MSKIIYTKTDEAPALATISFLPIVKAFTKSSKINIETRDISLSSRILANFSENLKTNQIVEDDLKYLVNLVNDINANIIKLPNISASIPQIKNAIKELQQLGYNIPEYPDDPENNSEKGIKKKFDLIKGSAVNPVLREGNSDRRVPDAIKNYAKRNPHSMGKWDKKSQTHVSTMKSGDFRNNEKSLTIKNKIDVSISHIDINGKEKILKDNLTIEKNEIIDASVLNKKDLLDFIENEIHDAKDKNLLLSIHLKATMMKVSDPILFGHVVKIFFKNIFQKYSKILNKIEANPNDGLGVLLNKIESLDSKTSKEIKKEQEVLGGKFDKNNYTSKRVWAKARDGKKVAISLVYRKDTELNEATPLLLYAYGSYGYTIPDGFSTTRLSLLDRGFVFALAHIRGSEYLGRQWYEDGKLLHKKNTFTDFVDCSIYLIKNKYTSAGHLYAMGGSAGGLLMGAIVNMNPELYNGVVAAVPFVDVVSTMLDESIPLTTGEFDEWGNPKDAKYYTYIKSYSPYDQVVAKAYPNMLVTTGLHDSQVQYWEPAKWVAKIRALKTDVNILLMHTNMEAGHGGASGRFNALKETARDYSFLLDLENKIK